MEDVAGFAFRRLLGALFTVWLLVTVVFFATRIMGDPVALLAGPDAGADEIAAIEGRLGLDQPLLVQYFDYVIGLLRGDAGESWRTGQDVTQMVFSRMPASARLGIFAILLATLVAVPVGIVSALKPGSFIDTTSRVGAVLGQSIPIFWLGILLILLFAVHLGWLPAGGRGGWEHLVLPGIALAVYSMPLIMRLTRSAMLEVLNKDYVRTARSKGLSERRVILVHATRNAMIPVITVIALRFGIVVSGLVVAEEVFAYPGLGSLAIQAMLWQDLPVVQVFIVFVVLLVVGVNFVADLFYQLADPRIRVS